MLAALARTMPPAVARAWWRRPAIAWLAPLAVAAAAAIVWVSVPRQTPVAPAAQSARAETPSPETNASLPSPPAVVTERQAFSTRESPRAGGAGSAGADERDRTPPKNRVPEAKEARRPADTRIIARSGRKPRQAPRLPNTDAQLPSTPLPQAAPLKQQRRWPWLTRWAATQAQERSFAEAAARGNQTAGRALALRLEAAPETTIVSSNPNIRWRLGRSGIVQHTSDGGSTWQAQETGVNVKLTAGSSPSPSVCWLVGAGGVVLVSTDEGRSWQRPAFPVAIDLRRFRHGRKDSAIADVRSSSVQRPMAVDWAVLV
jgi:hypothetical protein